MLDPDANTKPSVKQMSWHPQIDYTDPDRVYEVLSVSSTTIGGTSINIVPVDETLRALRPTGFYLAAEYLKRAEPTFKVGDRVMLDPDAYINRDLDAAYPSLKYGTVYTIGGVMAYGRPALVTLQPTGKTVYANRLMPAPAEVPTFKVGDRVMLDPESERNRRNLKAAYPHLSYGTVYTIERIRGEIVDLDIDSTKNGVYGDRLMLAPAEEVKPEVSATITFTCTCGKVHTLFTTSA